MIHIGLKGCLGAALLVAAGVPARADDSVPPVQAGHFSRCEVNGSGIEYRSYLPDQRRYVFVAVKVMKGIHPSVFVLFDKNFDGKVANLSDKSDPLVAWWLDRSRPMTFSADKIRIGWQDRSGFKWITTRLWEDADGSLAQPIRGLTQAGDRFEGTGTSDNNAFAFQARLELSDFGGDAFSVLVPSVSFDGVTVAPPLVQFTDTDENPTAKC